MKLEPALIDNGVVINFSRILIFHLDRSPFLLGRRAREIGTVGIVGTRHWRYQFALLDEQLAQHHTAAS